MKKYILLFIFASGISIISNAQNYWQQMDSIKGSGKAACGSFVLGTDGFIMGGLDDFGFKRKMYSYKPDQNDWDDETSIGGDSGDGLDRGSACSFSINGKGYLCLGQGQTNPYFKDLWEYDPATGAWTQKADFEGSSRRQAVCFTIDNIAYVGTGQDATGLLKDFYKYDPLINDWIQLNDFPGTARRQAVGFSMGAEGYIGTGDDGVLKNDFWQYIPASDSWIQKANFPGTPRAGAVGWAIFPTAFIATGEDVNFEYTNDVWEYNFYGNSWIQRADLIGPGRKNAIAFVINDIAYLGSGYNGTFLDDFYAYYGIAGLNDVDNLQISVYPNPAIDYVTIKFEGNYSDLDMKFYSISGSEVTDKVRFNNSSSSIQVDISNLESGNYFYSIKSSKNEAPLKGKLIVL